jgi:hypothetical protein
VIDLEQRNFSAHAPEVQGPPSRPPRKNRDRLPEVRNAPPMPVCKPAQEDGVNYSFMGTTGLEE